MPEIDKYKHLYTEIESHLLQDIKPSVYLKSIYHKPVFRLYPFSLLRELKKTEQSPKHHSEGNVWNHTLLVVDEAANVKDKSENKKVFMWAALLHDLGKPSTTVNKKGRITSYKHDKVGEELAKEFLKIFTEDQDFINQVSQLVRYHMQILFVVNDLPFADVKGMKRHTDIREVALLGLCDRLGRGGRNRREEEENIKKFLQKCE